MVLFSFMVSNKCDDQIPDDGDRPITQEKAAGSELTRAGHMGSGREEKRMSRIMEGSREKVRAEQ
eukprot:11800494-Heterocapsa_arctica.AAC.1